MLFSAALLARWRRMMPEDNDSERHGNGVYGDGPTEPQMISDISAGAAGTTVEEVLAATRSECSNQAVLCLILRPQTPLGSNGFAPVQGDTPE